MKFELEGYNVDNLIKILYLKKIPIYNLNRKSHKEISFEILDKHEKKVKRYIYNFKVRKTLSKFKQMPKFLLANLGVILGCFVGIIFFLFASNYTWQIQVFGASDIPVSNIIEVLHNNGVRKGKINHQTSAEIEDILLNHYDMLAQVSVIKRGTAIIINVSEKLVYDAGEFTPITAKYNGIIKEISVITGTNNVKVGDYVQAGDVLVLPFNVNADGSKVPVEPKAEIKAEIFYITKTEMQKTEKVLVRSGRTQIKHKYKFKSINLFSSKLKNSFALFEVVMYNENISDMLPLNRDCFIYYELIESEITHDFDAEKQDFIDENIRLSHENLPVGEILNENTKTQVEADKMFCITTTTIFGIIT